MSADREQEVMDQRLAHARLLEVLSYDRDTGQFIRRKKTNRKVVVGAVAGWTTKNGYCKVMQDGKTFSAHRLAWFYVHGVWPAYEIDHINGDPSDNRIANLRDVSRAVNTQNQRRASKRGAGTSALLGVQKDRRRFRARIGVGGKYFCLGSFATEEEAYSAYVCAKRRLHEGCTI